MSAPDKRSSDPVGLYAYVEGVRQVEAARLLARLLRFDVEGNRHG